MNFLKQLFAIIDAFLFRKASETVKEVISSPVAPQPQPEPVKSLLVPWAKAIELYEGANKAWNNPGAIRGADGQFLKFKTYQEGFAYLCDYLTRAATGKHKAYRPDMTLLAFQKVYSPSSDNNNPEKYASFIAKRIGVDITTPIKYLI